MKVVNKKRTFADINRGDCFMWNEELYIKVDYSVTVKSKDEFTAICLTSGESIMIYDEEEVDLVEAFVTCWKRGN